LAICLKRWTPFYKDWSGIALTHFITHIVESLGYIGILLAMTLESACIPVPSEVIMPFGRYIVATGRLSLSGVVLAGTPEMCWVLTSLTPKGATEAERSSRDTVGCKISPT
jgi:hypothetical protein